jgi:hypothetical protein
MRYRLTMQGNILRGVNNGGTRPPQNFGWMGRLHAMSPPEFGWKLIVMSNIFYEFLVISLQISWRLIHLYKPRVCWILSPFLISIVRNFMHWTSLHCFVTFHQDPNYVDAFFGKFDKKTYWYFTVWCNQWQTVYCVWDRQYLILFVSQNLASIYVVQAAKGLTVKVKAIKCLP